MKRGNVKSKTVSIEELCLRTFFCNRITLVHFFSNSPSYFLDVAASNASPMLASVRSAAAALERLLEARYAMIDLCLVAADQQLVGTGYCLQTPL